MDDSSHVVPERIVMAELWRVLGEKLRKRSPHAFAKLMEMLTTSTIGVDDDDAEEIDDVYRIH